MMNHSTNGLYQRYNALCRVFPPFMERQVQIVDFGPWGCFSAVTENGETTHYDYDIENPDRYCPNRKDQPEQPKQPTQPNQTTKLERTESEPPSFSSRVPENPASAFTRCDYQPPQPSDPLLYDHLTKFDKGPPLNPSLWETGSPKPPIREGPRLRDNPPKRISR